MLPDDRELLADLTAPKYTVTPRGIQIEPKEKLVKRLGRSPDRGDAIVMAWSSGQKAVTDMAQWKERQVGSMNGRRPVVVAGRAAARRAR